MFQISCSRTWNSMFRMVMFRMDLNMLWNSEHARTWITWLEHKRCVLNMIEHDLNLALRLKKTSRLSLVYLVFSTTWMQAKQGPDQNWPQSLGPAWMLWQRSWLLDVDSSLQFYTKFEKQQKKFTQSLPWANCVNLCKQIAKFTRFCPPMNMNSCSEHDDHDLNMMIMFEHVP